MNLTLNFDADRQTDNANSRVASRLKKFQIEARNSDNGEIMKEGWNNHMLFRNRLELHICKCFGSYLKDFQSDLPHEALEEIDWSCIFVDGLGF